MFWFPSWSTRLASWADPDVIEAYDGFIVNSQTDEVVYIEDYHEAEAECDKRNALAQVAQEANDA